MIEFPDNKKCEYELEDYQKEVKNGETKNIL